VRAGSTMTRHFQRAEALQAARCLLSTLLTIAKLSGTYRFATLEVSDPAVPLTSTAVAWIPAKLPSPIRRRRGAKTRTDCARRRSGSPTSRFSPATIWLSLRDVIRDSIAIYENCRREADGRVPAIWPGYKVLARCSKLAARTGTRLKTRAAVGAD